MGSKIVKLGNIKTILIVIYNCKYKAKNDNLTHIQTKLENQVAADFLGKHVFF